MSIWVLSMTIFESRCNLVQNIGRYLITCKTWQSLNIEQKKFKPKIISLNREMWIVRTELFWRDLSVSTRVCVGTRTIIMIYIYLWNGQRVRFIISRDVHDREPGLKYPRVHDVFYSQRVFHHAIFLSLFRQSIPQVVLTSALVSPIKQQQLEDEHSIHVEMNSNTISRTTTSWKLPPISSCPSDRSYIHPNNDILF